MGDSRQEEGGRGLSADSGLLSRTFQGFKAARGNPLCQQARLIGKMIEQVDSQAREDKGSPVDLVV